MKANQIKITKDLFAQESTLQEYDPVTIQMRSDCLVKFNKIFKKALKFIRIDERNEAGTLANRHFKCRDIALTSIINSQIDDALRCVDDGGTPEINVNRRKAMEYEESGKIDHEGKYSIYGQIISALKNHGYTELTNFRHKDVDGRVYKINFKGEGSIDAGGPFRDSISNIVKEMEDGFVPLLIKSPNNRNDHGQNRDCYLLDPASTSPTHLEMFRFLGGFIAFGILSKQPIPLNLTPTVWKQILGQPLTLEDLTQMDAYSS